MPESSGDYGIPVFIKGYGWITMAPREGGMTINEEKKSIEAMIESHNKGKELELKPELKKESAIKKG